MNLNHAIGLAALLTACAGASAQVTWNVNGHTYQLTPAASSWSAAEGYAQSIGGHLVSIESAAEQAFIESNFLSIPTAAPRPLWIGLIRTGGIGSGGFDFWTDGSAVGFSNWYPGEPNNFTGNGQTNGEWVGTINWHTAQINGPIGTWNDTPDAGTFGFGGSSDGPYFGIVETVPTPASAFALSVGLTVIGRRRR